MPMRAPLSSSEPLCASEPFLQSEPGGTREPSRRSEPCDRADHVTERAKRGEGTIEQEASRTN
jgi:hypothetical protein